MGEIPMVVLYGNFNYTERRRRKKNPLLRSVYKMHSVFVCVCVHLSPSKYCLFSRGSLQLDDKVAK